jgi:D-alanyl-D-alanine carboxypeptidase
MAVRDGPESAYYWHIASIRLGKRIYRNTNGLIDAYAGTDGMKTGFTCASGYNLVATATRGGRRLIAVVLGARSSASRAVKAAQLFERGFAPATLGSVVPAPRTVDSLEPVAATPPDLREDVCEHNRRHRPIEDEGGEAGTAPHQRENLGDRLVLPRSSARNATVLTSGLAAGIPPVEVYTGPLRNDIRSDGASAAPVPNKTPVAVAAVPRVSKRLSSFRRQHLRLRQHSR